MKPSSVAISMNICIALMCFFYITTSFAETSEVRVKVATGQLPPLSSQNSHHYGYANHIITMAFANVGVDVEFHFLPWARAYKEAQNGNYAATSYWYRDEKHTGHFYQGDTLLVERVVFFRRKSSLFISDFQDIKSNRLMLGLTRGYTYNEEIWQWARDNPNLVSVVTTDVQNMQMLMLGRIDVFPAEEISGWYSLNKNFGAEQVQTLETIAQVLLKREALLMFSKKHPDGERLSQQFNDGLKILKSSGMLDEIELNFVSGFYSEKEVQATSD